MWQWTIGTLTSTSHFCIYMIPDGLKLYIQDILKDGAEKIKILPKEPIKRDRHILVRKISNKDLRNEMNKHFMRKV